MKMIITIEVDDLSELVQVERALRDFPAEPTVTNNEPKAEKPKKETAAQKKKRLAKEKKAKAAAEEAEILGDDDEAPTVEDVEKAVKVFIQANSVPAVKKVLKEFDAKKLSDIEEDQYAAVIERLEE
jgi:DNA replication protein DnaC